MNASGVTPKRLGLDWVDDAFKENKAIGESTRQGYLMMEEVKGRPLGILKKESLAASREKRPDPFTDKQRDSALTSFVRARGKMHKQSIAHNDMHSGNFMYDVDSQKGMIIDFGGAAIDSRKALVEALGTDSDPSGVLALRSIRGNSEVLETNKSWKRFLSNREKVQATIKAEGHDELLDAMALMMPDTKISEKRALELIEMLYDGV